MRFQLLTIFPELFRDFRSFGLISRALAENAVQLDTVQLRDYAVNSYGAVDDTPYGGGSGMVLRVEPAIAALKKAKQVDPKAKVVLFSPRGTPLTQKLARRLLAEQQSAGGGFILLCSRYEGVDQRIADTQVDLEISIGDYVLMGGEVPAMAFVETLTRLIPGVLGNPQSTQSESFENGMLEYPHYTKPAEYQGLTVPPVLLSGNHQEIARWRNEQALATTRERRPDLLPKRTEITCELSVALIHFPVMNKEKKIITSSVTNLDLHDIARSAKTYGLTRYYIAHPVKTMRRLCEKIYEHWSVGYGSTYNPNRSEALESVSLVSELDDCILDIENRTGKLPKLITTSAKPSPRAVSFSSLRKILCSSTDPHLLLLGTGWGLAPELLERADYHLEPIDGPTNYNHLSVRAAAAIMFDRLLAPISESDSNT